MPTDKGLLTFELADDDEELEIHCDEEGLRRLIAACSRVLETRAHDHLMTPSWGGTELSEERQGRGNRLLNKVTVRLWPGR